MCTPDSPRTSRCSVLFSLFHPTGRARLCLAMMAGFLSDIAVAPVGDRGLNVTHWCGNIQIIRDRHVFTVITQIWDWARNPDVIFKWLLDTNMSVSLYTKATLWFNILTMLTLILRDDLVSLKILVTQHWLHWFCCYMWPIKARTNIKIDFLFIAFALLIGCIVWNKDIDFECEL